MKENLAETEVTITNLSANHRCPPDELHPGAENSLSGNRNAVEEMAEGYWEVDLKGQFTFLNAYLANMLGLPAEEVLKLKRNDLVGEASLKKWDDLFEQILRTGVSVREIVDEVTLAGSGKIWVESTVWLRSGSDGSPVGFGGISRDITARVQAQEEIRKGLERYRTIIEEMPDSYWETDLEGKYTFFNEQHLRAHRRTREEMMSGNVALYVDEGTADRNRETLRHVYRTGEPARGVAFHLTRGDGSTYHAESNICLIKDPGGKPIGFRGTSRDVTERKRVEEELRQSEERYRTVIEEMADSYWETDLAGHFTFFNNQVMVEQKRTREELLALNNSTNRQHLDAENLEKAFRFLSEVYATGKTARGATYELIRGDGSRYSIESSISLMRDGEGNPVGFRGISRDVTGRLKQEKELKQAKEAAEAANRAKSEFTANVSHEIRTPMNGILGMTELALGTELTSEQREYLNSVKDSADCLLTLINEILDFSKIESGRLQLDPIEFRLRDSVESSLRTLALRAHQKGLELSCYVAPEAPDVLIGDASKLRQILVNLVGNAVKFTSQGQVIVGVFPEDSGFLHFSVRDSGIGIPADKQEMIFEAFSQVDSTTSRRYGGTGLGLAISSKLVALMGGRIWLESKPGIGSSFHFTARFDSNGISGTLGARQGDHCESFINTGQGPEGKARSYRILLAEDNVINQRIAVRLLEKQGHSVVLAANGEEAVNIYQNGGVDLILMDVQMPEMNGYEATAAIREIERASRNHVPIIAMTAHAMKGDRERCLEAGMDGYLSKPVKFAQVLEELERVAAPCPD